MNQETFLQALRQELSPLPPEERERFVDDYREMLYDRIEDGASEEEAVASLGSPQEIAQQILQEVPLTTLVKARMKPKRKLEAWEIVLLAVGFPVWLPLLIAFAAILFSLFIVAVALIFTVTAVGAAFAIGGPVGMVVGVMQMTEGLPKNGVVLIGCSLVLLGLGILLCIGGVKLFGVFFRWLARALRKLFTKKEESSCPED